MASFFITTATTPIAAKLSFKLNILDYPSDPVLNIHKKPMPLLGGMALCLGITSSLIIILFLYKPHLKITMGVLSSVLFVFFLGLMDDIKEIKPLLRFLGQICAALIFIFICGITADFLPFWFVSIPLTILFIVASINALNLLDGLDGLAAGTTLIASLGFFAVYFLKGDILWASISLILAGATAGFLIFNFHPARIFLGDNGSTVLGFLLGILAVRFVSKPYSLIRLIIPGLILIVPVLDLILAVMRRLLRKKPISIGDRDHIYDKLIKRGFSQKQTALITYLFGFIGASTAIIIFLI